MTKPAAFLFLALLLAPLASQSQPVGAPMPPTFKRNAAIEQTLRAYPLGVITEQMAFSHHGEPHRKLKLPNGLTGWIYDVGGLPVSAPYVSPTGKKQTVTETDPSHAARSYTLVFDNRGIVVDVLYNERGRHDGLTALALQNAKGVRPEEHTHTGPRSGQ